VEWIMMRCIGINLWRGGRVLLRLLFDVCTVYSLCYVLIDLRFVARWHHKAQCTI